MIQNWAFLPVESMGNTTFAFFPHLFQGTCKAEIFSFWDNHSCSGTICCLHYFDLTPLWPAVHLRFPPLRYTHAVSALTQRTRLWHVSTARIWLRVLNLTWLYSHRNPRITGRAEELNDHARFCFCKHCVTMVNSCITKLVTILFKILKLK